MNKLVYIVGGKCELMRDILSDKGYEVILGDGVCDDSILFRCDALMPGMPNKVNVTGELLAKAPKLAIVAKTGVGVETIDIPACTARGIYVSNTPDGNYIAVAEHTMMLLLAVARQIYPVSICMHGEKPDAGCRSRYKLTELYGKTIVLVGLGHIGRRVAQLAAGFNMKIIGVVRHPVDPALLPDGLVQMTSLHEALPLGDFVSLHVTGNDETRDLITAKEFALMKPGTIFINTARGFVVNEADLIGALKSGAIAGAGLDVTLHDPIEAGNPLAMMDNVVITPHHSVETPETFIRMQEQCARNIIDALEGRRPESSLNDPSRPA